MLFMAGDVAEDGQDDDGSQFSSPSAKRIKTVNDLHADLVSHGHAFSWLPKNVVRYNSDAAFLTKVRVLGRDNVHFSENPASHLFSPPRPLDILMEGLLLERGISRMTMPSFRVLDSPDTGDGSTSSSELWDSFVARENCRIAYVGSPWNVDKLLSFERWIFGECWKAKRNRDTFRRSYDCSVNRQSRAGPESQRPVRPCVECPCTLLRFTVELHSDLVDVVVFKGSHSHDIRSCGKHARLDPSIVDQIKEGLLQGKSVTAVREEIVSLVTVLAGRNGYLADELNKMLVPDKKCIRNIYYNHVYHADRFSRDDIEDLYGWITQPGLVRGTVLSKYAVTDTVPSTVTQHLKVVIHSAVSVAILRKFAPKGRILLDSTHGTNELLWPCYSLGVVVNNRKGQQQSMVVARMITSDNSESAVESFLNWINACLEDRSPPADCLIDNDAREKRAIDNVWHGNCNILLCYFHFMQAWERWLKKYRIRPEHRQAIVGSLESMCHARDTSVADHISSETKTAIDLWIRAAHDDDHRSLLMKLRDRFGLYTKSKSEYLRQKNDRGSQLLADGSLGGLGDDVSIMYKEFWCQVFWSSSAVRTTNPLEVAHHVIKHGEAYCGGSFTRRIGDFARKLEKGDHFKLIDFVMHHRERVNSHVVLPQNILNDWEKSKEVVAEVRMGTRPSSEQRSEDNSMAEGLGQVSTVSREFAPSSTGIQGCVSTIVVRSHGGQNTISDICCTCRRFAGSSFCKHIVAAAVLRELEPQLKGHLFLCRSFVVDDLLLSVFHDHCFERAVETVNANNLREKLTMINPSLFDVAGLCHSNAGADGTMRLCREEPLDNLPPASCLSFEDGAPFPPEAVVPEARLAGHSSWSLSETQAMLQIFMEKVRTGIRHPGNRADAIMRAIIECDSVITSAMGDRTLGSAAKMQPFTAYGSKAEKSKTSTISAAAKALTKAQGKAGRPRKMENSIQRQESFQKYVIDLTRDQETEIVDMSEDQPSANAESLGHSPPHGEARTKDVEVDIERTEVQPYFPSSSVPGCSDSSGNLLSLSDVQGFQWDRNSCAVDTFIELFIRNLSLMPLWNIKSLAAQKGNSTIAQMLLTSTIQRAMMPLPKATQSLSHASLRSYLSTLKTFKSAVYDIIEPFGHFRGEMLNYLALEMSLFANEGSRPSEDLVRFKIQGTCFSGHPITKLVCVLEPSFSSANVGASKDASETATRTFREAFEATLSNATARHLSCSQCKGAVCWNIDSISFSECPVFLMVSVPKHGMLSSMRPSPQGDIQFIEQKGYEVSFGSIVYKLVSVVFWKNEIHFCGAFVRPMLDSLQNQQTAEWCFYDGISPAYGAVEFGHRLSSICRKNGDAFDVCSLTYIRTDVLQPPTAEADVPVFRDGGKMSKASRESAMEQRLQSIKQSFAHQAQSSTGRGRTNALPVHL
eukprot:ANDGO_01896.mRNA.1 hypothetical protein